MPVTKNCEFCGNAFSIRPAKAFQRFCSKTCQQAKRESAHEERTCAQCGSLFVITRKRELDRRFCTKACVSAHEAIHGRPAARYERSETTTFACEQCGTPFSYKAGYLAEYRRKYGRDPKYCSIKCFGIVQRAKADIAHTVPCKNCGTMFVRSRRGGSGNIYREQALCSRQCKNEWVSKVYREKHGLPQITRRVKRGYVVLRIPASAARPVQTDVLEHRYVMEQHLGRALLPTETVHHKRAFDKTCNDLENLELRTGNHGPGGAVEDIIPWCLEMLALYPQFITAEQREALARLAESG